MVTHKEAIDVIENTVAEHSDIPDEMSFLTHEADPDGEDAYVSVPLIELYDASIERDDPSNTNLAGYITNDSGERTGYIFETKWLMELRADIWVAAGSSYDVDALGKKLKAILYTYDSKGPDITFTTTDGTPVDSIYDFSLGSGERDDSLAETPSIRKWSQPATVRGAETLTLPASNPIVKTIDETTDTQ